MIKTLYKNEFKNIIREPMLAFLYIMLLFIPLIFTKLLIPGAEHFLSFILPDELLTFIIVLEMMLLGLIHGLFLIDEIDEKSISSIMMTPVGRKGYLRFKAVDLYVQSLLFAVYGLVIIEPSTVYLAPFIALTAPLSAFILSAFGQNKIEAMAMGKLVGFMIMLPLATIYYESWIMIPVRAFPLFYYIEHVETGGLIPLIIYALSSIGFTMLVVQKTLKRIY